MCYLLLKASCVVVDVVRVVDVVQVVVVVHVIVVNVDVVFVVAYSIGSVRRVIHDHEFSYRIIVYNDQ